MKLRVLTAALFGVCLIAPAMAAGKPVDARLAQAKREFAAMKASDVAAAPTPTATTGDPDSFGRAVKFLGLMTSGVVQMAADCTPDPDFPPGPDDHCYNPNPTVGAETVVTYNDIGRMLIPGKSANSVFCHWQSPSSAFIFHNSTGATVTNARFAVSTTYTIENSVLNDPALIDPNTGLPFNGKFTVTISTIRDERNLQSGEVHVGRALDSRVCINGIVSRNSLVNGYGLSAAQAANFFKNDTIITLGMTVRSRHVDDSSVIVSTRIVGD
jgi:hypothetical protein